MSYKTCELCEEPYDESEEDLYEEGMCKYCTEYLRNKQKLPSNSEYDLIAYVKRVVKVLSNTDHSIFDDFYSIIEDGKNILKDFNNEGNIL